MASQKLTRVSFGLRSNDCNEQERKKMCKANATETACSFFFHEHLILECNACTAHLITDINLLGVAVSQ